MGRVNELLDRRSPQRLPGDHVEELSSTSDTDEVPTDNGIGDQTTCMPELTPTVDETVTLIGRRFRIGLCQLRPVIVTVLRVHPRNFRAVHPCNFRATSPVR
jgi:hypothetical protein